MANTKCRHPLELHKLLLLLAALLLLLPATVRTKTTNTVNNNSNNNQHHPSSNIPRGGASAPAKTTKSNAVLANALALPRNSPAAHRSVNTELVQHFPAPRSVHWPSANKTLIFVALLPSAEAANKNDCIMPKVLPVLELAIEHLQRRFVWSHGVQLDYTLISRDSFCSSIYGPIGMFEIYTQWQEVNAIFGLPCDYVLAPISRYAGVWQIPVLTSGGNAADFENKADSYPTMTRIKGAQVNNLGNAVLAIVEHFNWTRTALIYQNSEQKGQSVCFFCIVAVHQRLDKMSVYQQAFDNMVWKKEDIVKMLTTVGKLTRIVIMCADPQAVRQIMLTAEELNMVDSGEYVFINIELFSRVPHITSQPWFDRNDTAENNERARKAYTAILTVTPKQPNDDEYTRVSNEIKVIAATKYNYKFHEDEPISAFVTSFFDGVLLYANALNDSISEDPTVLTRPINGTDMVRRMWNRSFRGLTGNVTIDSNGDRISAYSLLDLNPSTGRFEIVANFLHNQLEYLPGKAIHWAGDRAEPPPDTPVCGYDGSLCPDNSLPGYAILSMVLGTIVFIMLIFFVIGYRHYKSEAEINSMAWKVSLDDVYFPDGSAVHGVSRGSFHSLGKQSSQVTLISEELGSFNGDRQIFIPICVYRNCKVAMKMIDVHNVNLSRSLMLELKRMKDLQHDHLVKFYGACLNPAKSFLLTEYCPKGSLQDILENEQFQLDGMFRLSLMHDIVRGMQFLHNSDIKSHGSLKSSNCVVDSRFVLKITDFGLHSLRRSPEDNQFDVEDCNSHSYWSKLLWTAPELLRLEGKRPPEGTQKADVYSFGIIVHEITTRQGPFFLGNPETQKSPKEIIELVQAGYTTLQVPQPFRPHIDCSATADVDVISMMTKCWSEEPLERPDFNALKTIIRKINKDNETGNIVDNLLKRMELYANNLEELVEERTQDYLEEKKKCEKLLYQLLPQSVAAQLISGQPVVAETFDQVTIYFSDIVGFTAISAESTPLQVVQFLNDLYTCFDSIVENFDVYKVETIGDAYMVVSGLPIRNGNRHAREIARLALALLEAVHNFHIHHRPNDRLKLRIGLHSGACVAGVVGLKMPRYCLFGDTVNTASRMESNGEALKIHISEKTKLALDEFGTFVTTKRGLVPMKGKGEMLTYWLEGEVPRYESPLGGQKFAGFSRRASMKHPPRIGGLYKLNLEQTNMLPAHVLLQSTEQTQNEQTRSHQSSRQSSPNLRVKRKISSSSPKLNVTIGGVIVEGGIGGGVGGVVSKTDSFDVMPLRNGGLAASHQQQQQQPDLLLLNGGDGDGNRCLHNNTPMAMPQAAPPPPTTASSPPPTAAGGGQHQPSSSAVHTALPPPPTSPTAHSIKDGSNWELANFRLPLSTALKNQNSFHGSGRSCYSPLLPATNSSSNLSGKMQPSALHHRSVKLKPPPPPATTAHAGLRSTTAAPADMTADTGSLHSGNRIKFYNVKREPHEDVEQLNPIRQSEHGDYDEEANDCEDRLPPYTLINSHPNRGRVNSPVSPATQAGALSPQPASNSSAAVSANFGNCNGNSGSSSSSSGGGSAYNNLVKANNMKNFQMSCRSNGSNTTNTSIAEETLAAAILNGGSGGSRSVDDRVGGVCDGNAALDIAAAAGNAVTQPLLGNKISLEGA